ncbi:restriction endonuclease subunit S [Pantoea ananatis]|uniref:restriction endonuclease subunit S n=1 Tax=Pantoea ananas TaxID=553 RepID=UPI0022214059|nr:restriction endonuclease subunit S [Pantoea ananatis]MCW1834497.1 restriction endonuclease subunit S [Pantoea ananatis]
MLKVSDLFALDYGHSLELNRLKQSTATNAINFVGRAARNNGVTAQVSSIPGLEPAPAGTISVALGGQGGAGTAFLQPKPYYCGRDVMILTAKKTMTEQEKLWWVTCITANRFRFGFGRQANRTLKDINLPGPENIPTWVHSVNFVKPFTNTLNQFKQQSSPSFATAQNTIGKTRVRVEDLFDITYGTSLELNRLQTDAKGINFIARTSKNNGITAKVRLPLGVTPITPGCISVAVSGSVLEAFVQQEPFLTGFHIMILRPKSVMYTEELMFYAVCIKAHQWRYSYGRQANRTLKDLLVPARESVPIWVSNSFTRVADRLAQNLID